MARSAAEKRLHEAITTSGSKRGFRSKHGFRLSLSEQQTKATSKRSSQLSMACTSAFGCRAGHCKADGSELTDSGSFLFPRGALVLESNQHRGHQAEVNVRRNRDLNSGSSHYKCDALTTMLFRRREYRLELNQSKEATRPVGTDRQKCQKWGSNPRGINPSRT